MFDHVTIRASDREASRAFYTAALGEPTYESEWFVEWGDFSLVQGEPTMRLDVAFAAAGSGHPERHDPDGNIVEVIEEPTSAESRIDRVSLRSRDVAAARAFWESVAPVVGMRLERDTLDSIRYVCDAGTLSIARPRRQQHRSRLPQPLNQARWSAMATPVEERKQPADRAVARLPEHDYDAIVLVSFGGPEGMDDVMPFLENVTRGRNVPRERLLDVAHHYELFGGVSPINEQNRALIAALEPELRAHGVELPVYFGNRNWQPYLTDTMRQMRDDGVRRALAVFTSAFSSYSGCRQYREDIFNAQQAVGDDAPEVPRVRMFFNQPGFIEANVARVRDALAQVPEGAHIAFTAHSIPTAMAKSCAYEAQLAEAARLVAEEVGISDWAIVYQSRSGPPQVPWLEPDIGDHLAALAERGVESVVISPIGFVSDHLEVLFDLDVEAKEIADGLGIAMARAGTAGTHPAFVAGLRELIVERLTPGSGRSAVGRFAASHDVCAPDCCLPGSGRPSPWDA